MRQEHLPHIGGVFFKSGIEVSIKSILASVITDLRPFTPSYRLKKALHTSLPAVPVSFLLLVLLELANIDPEVQVITHPLLYNYNKMSIKILPVILLSLILLTGATECEDYVKTLISDIEAGHFAKIPLPAILYSGLAPNCPGQFLECKKSLGFSYYLVYFPAGSNV